VALAPGAARQLCDLFRIRELASQHRRLRPFRRYSPRCR
jgi:hypothetical protein